MSERLSKGARKYIARLKQDGESGKASQVRREELDGIWKRRLSQELKPGSEGLEGYNQLENGVKGALQRWFNIRYDYQINVISSSEFEQKRKEFGAEFGEILDSPLAETGFRIILGLTKKS